MHYIGRDICLTKGHKERRGRLTRKTAATYIMSTTSVNNEKKTRVIKETKKEDFLAVVNSFREIVNAEDFDETICKATGNGLYKYTTTRPTDMTGVKDETHDDLKWYKVPTTDYAVALGSYIDFRLTCKAKARSNAMRQIKDLSTEELLALVAAMKK